MEEDTKDLLQRGYKKYTGHEVDVYFHTGKCTHAANCLKYLPATFNMNRKPWILPDAALREDVKRVIATCPSEALIYIEKNDSFFV
ncbi:(4Fe-4S)-binding protein [Psychrobacillus sp. NEAU-3TGS]|uniref:(4Fe-4S)-binding protein n=1 Tax=Psychrobacillus sp. NEAU-3TGS TaxID=2995412 RepID=UPI002495CAFA|nr:(4Fe-4S)-binding protein [Psychrobacillus sp. NEAU-3TGS]MDI2588892.1 (4Fe-4S)-binding protein [Psychrobacillus sp. NEAU-3TGS]